MYQPPEDDQHNRTHWETVVSYVGLLLRLCCCLNQDDDTSLGSHRSGSRANLLLESRDREAALETALSPPRAPLLEHRSPSPGKGAPSDDQQYLLPERRQQRWQWVAAQQGAAGEGHDSDGSGGGGGGNGSQQGGSKQEGKTSSKEDQLSLLEDDDICPTCLEPYTEDNPKVLTRCSHHFHLPCIYEWLERSETCPMCGAEMKFEELL